MVIRIVSSNNGTLPIVGVVVVVVVSIVSTHEFVTPVVVKFAPVAAKTDNMGIVMTINSIALRRKRNIRKKRKKIITRVSVAKINIKARVIMI